MYRSITFFKRIIPCIFILLGVFLIDGSGWARKDKDDVISDRIEKLQKEIEKSRKELENSEKKLKQKEKEKQDELEELKHTERKIEVLHQNLSTINSEEKRLNREKGVAQKQYNTVSQSLKTHYAEYANRLRSIYKRQRISALEMLFTTGSTSSMLRGFKMFSVMAENDVKLLETIRSQRQTSEKSMRTITAALKAQRALQANKKREEISLGNTRKDRKKLIDEIKKDEELLKKRKLQIQQDMENALAQLEKWLRQIEREVKTFEISDNLKKYNFAGRKGTLPWPVNGRVVSSFGVNIDPKTKTKTTNRGMEIETTHGEPVYSIGSGVVVRTQFIRGYGNFVWIYHPPHYYSIYAHLSDILVNQSSEVREGGIIGLAGSTGLMDDSRAMLLLEILNGKKPENPLRWLKPDKQRSRS